MLLLEGAPRVCRLSSEAVLRAEALAQVVKILPRVALVTMPRPGRTLRRAGRAVTISSYAQDAIAGALVRTGQTAPVRYVGVAAIVAL